jgi:hypothetical protein
MNKKITQKDVEQYATWVLNDCMHPQDEIEWLVNTILNSDDVHYVIEEVIADLSLTTFKNHKFI